uniref:hypothetical protein n=1 Tax=uncultured Erythrobacter sp. TaxID=263913 RepID=UPI002602E161|nr:hypothetical protein [uncultured Erythrobacter sp.]
MGDPLSQFRADWLARINSGAKTIFEYGALEGGVGLHASVADQYVSALGFKAIGFNWELLDASADSASPRSAIAELTAAMANDISNPSQAWLGDKAARQAADALINGFDRGTLTVVANRYDGLWNPISGAAVEWGFVLFDSAKIALLLITE